MLLQLPRSSSDMTQPIKAGWIAFECWHDLDFTHVHSLNGGLQTCRDLAGRAIFKHPDFALRSGVGLDLHLL